MEKYTQLNDKHKRWISAMIEGMVSSPKSVEYARHFSGINLEIEISVAFDDRPVFTPEVCTALAVIIGQVTGVPEPVVYLEDNPHPEAAAALRYATSQLNLSFG